MNFSYTNIALWYAVLVSYVIAFVINSLDTDFKRRTGLSIPGLEAVPFVPLFEILESANETIYHLKHFQHQVSTVATIGNTFVTEM